MPLQEQPNPEAIKKALLVHVPAAKQDFLATFLEGVLKLYRGLNFAYMEVNPLVRTCVGGLLVLIDGCGRSIVPQPTCCRYTTPSETPNHQTNPNHHTPPTQPQPTNETRW